MVPARPGVIGSDAWVRSRAWIWLFSSMHNTIAFSGGFKYSPTTSMSLSSNFGSVDTLKVSTRCGAKPRSDQIRCTVAGLTPTCLAIVRHDQCVAPGGVVVVVNSTIRAIGSPGIEGLRPRPSRIFSSPANPPSTNRVRHARTVTGVTPTSSAITALATPSAASNNTLACTTSRCGADCARANLSNVSRSPSDNGNGAAGALMTPRYRTTHYLFTRHTTRAAWTYWPTGQWWLRGQLSARRRRRAPGADHAGMGGAADQGLPVRRFT